MPRVTTDIYILRIWLESAQAGSIWRASITDAKAQQKHYFATPEALVEFVAALVNCKEKAATLSDV